MLDNLFVKKNMDWEWEQLCKVYQVKEKACVFQE